ncbi:hypothetical protein ASC80_01605 [Afipia sp. Root123D2]|uniref:hypothetical protein n=1 Tax=Afipia sp. Root123D2 TaxID=1736436 RepID=UPI0006F9917D|nr:hypothetical protein [Afipia sp. Root123D2]KQW22118.1 hypothetical protein ASC80_01605 [Afipia sp. Root123D2]
MSDTHSITRSIVSGNGASVYRARCSCGLRVDAPRLSVAGRRKQARAIAKHLADVGQVEQPELAT